MTTSDTTVQDTDLHLVEASKSLRYISGQCSDRRLDSGHTYPCSLEPRGQPKKETGPVAPSLPWCIRHCRCIDSGHHVARSATKRTEHQPLGRAGDCRRNHRGQRADPATDASEIFLDSRSCSQSAFNGSRNWFREKQCVRKMDIHFILGAYPPFPALHELRPRTTASADQRRIGDRVDGCVERAQQQLRSVKEQ